ncbi:NudC family protein [Cardiosporidium cionae]|uniref:Nuclear migration protein nudC n=1 Tax=Cardiosporidium cionae TaxID=476202 RepID=A0ABQ7J7G0_9APIC|nr:NudC family protein [Cardiosporidium cionae]|eukprot:KAF8819920.1 NudC family protein [Cardiosporidium cionae]
MASNFAKFDYLLGSFAKEHDTIESLLNTFFEWLRERTDFFHVAQPSSSTAIGFHEGEAERMLKEIFLKHQKLYRSATLPNRLANIPASTTFSPSSHKKEAMREVPPAQSSQFPGNGDDEGTEIVISPVPRRFRGATNAVQSEIQKFLGKRGKCLSVRWPSAEDLSKVIIAVDSESIAEWIINESQSKNRDLILWEEDLSQNLCIEIIRTERYSNQRAKVDRSNDAANSTNPRHGKHHITPYNGAILDKYVWNQTFQEVTVEFPLNTNCKKHDLEIVIDFQYLLIKCKGKILTDGQLCRPINREDSVWTIEDENTLILTLYKKEEYWWQSVIIGDPEIDLTKVESKKSVEDYDGKMQAQIRKIWHQQAEKALSKAEKMDQSDLLKKAWNAEGSPFKGQPFDPSLLRFN